MKKRPLALQNVESKMNTLRSFVNFGVVEEALDEEEASLLYRTKKLKYSSPRLLLEFVDCQFTQMSFAD